MWLGNMLKEKEPTLGVLLDEFVAAGLEEFRAVYGAHPLNDGPNDGAISVSEAFWLYWIVKEMQPGLIVESGTLRGWSAYFLRMAAPKETVVHCFDPYHAPELAMDGLRYHACDWGEVDLGTPPQEAVVFFDDHRSHALRLRQAFKRGFPYALFHDNHVTTGHDVWPLRFTGVGNMARLCFTFPRLGGDEIFTDRTYNPQNYRWLTFVEILL